MSGFQYVKLKDCCDVIGGSTPKRNIPEYWIKEIPWVTPKDMSSLKSPFLNDAPEYISKQGYNSCSTYLLPKNSILLTSRAPIGNVAIAGREMCTNQGFKSLVPHNGVDFFYLYYCIKYQSPKLQALGNGATFKEISKKIVEDFEIPLPSLREQKRIAAILYKADAVRRKRQQAIELSEQLLRSVFLDMFGDPSAQNWKLTTVEKIAEDKKGSIRTGPFGSQLLHSEFTDSGVSVLGIDNAVKNIFQWAKQRYISEEKYTKLKRYTVYPGDLIITIMGTCGRVAIVPDDCPRAINTKHLCCITLDKDVCTPEYIHSYFLMHQVSLEYLARSAKGAIMDGLNMGIIKELPVYLPPLSLQNKYSSFYKKLFNDRKRVVFSLEIAEELFNSLSQKAFNGELSKRLETELA